MPRFGKWSLVYKQALQSDGTLYFPERLSQEFLEETRKTQGSYVFANQYQNEVIPENEKKFKTEWLKYWRDLPTGETYTFAFIDPAIGQNKQNDYTGTVVIQVTSDGIWYVLQAKRDRLSPTQIVNRVFDLQKMYKCQAIGIESTAYQEALLYLIAEESRRRGIIVPLKGIKPAWDKSKETRILALVPRFEWGRILLAQGLYDFEEEYSQFPRGGHDDLIDPLAQMEEIVFYPSKPETKQLTKPDSPLDPDYERWVIRQMVNKANQREDNE